MFSLGTPVCIIRVVFFLALSVKPLSSLSMFFLMTVIEEVCLQLPWVFMSKVTVVVGACIVVLVMLRRIFSALRG